MLFDQPEIRSVHHGRPLDGVVGVLAKDGDARLLPQLPQTLAPFWRKPADRLRC